MGSATELDEGQFDIILCDYLLEYVENSDSVVSVIARHLDSEGAYCVSTNNKWWPLEGHYGLPLPFVSWLPRTWAGQPVRPTVESRHRVLGLRDIVEQPQGSP